MNPDPERVPAAHATTQPGADRPGVLVHPPLLFGGTFAVGMLLHALRPTPISSLGATRGAGVLLILAGVSLAVWGRRTMVRAGTNVNPKLPATTLVVTGPFRYVRNPLYTALSLLYAGLALAVNAAGPLLLLPAVVCVLHFGVVRREERYLETKFGEAYLRYKAVTRRWI